MREKWVVRVTALLDRTAANRRRIADLYDGIGADRMDGPSLCRGWSLRTLLGHVVMPLVTSPARLLWETVRAGSVHRASTVLAARLAQRPVADLTGILRERADRKVAAPGVGEMGQFVDCCIHLEDAARPLGVRGGVPLEDWALVLPWLPSRAAGLGHVPRGLLAGLTWEAADCGWRYGAGPRVSGSAEALALGMTGRPAALPDLRGPGVEILRTRLDQA